MSKGKPQDTVAEEPISDVMTAGEAAKYLKVSRQTVYDCASRQEIPHRRIGQRYIFSRKTLLTWLECGYAQKD